MSSSTHPAVIAISGKSGCGNSTVSRLVAERLGLRLINYTFHSIAEERGMSFEALYELAEKDSSYDLLLDEKQVELAKERNCVLGSRLAIWLADFADLRVYLSAGAEVRSRRIAKRERVAIEEAFTRTVDRDRRDRDRYLRLYEIDIDDYQDHADLVIDAELGDQYWITETIVHNFTKRNLP